MFGFMLFVTFFFLSCRKLILICKTLQSVFVSVAVVTPQLVTVFSLAFQLCKILLYGNILLNHCFVNFSIKWLFASTFYYKFFNFFMLCRSYILAFFFLLTYQQTEIKFNIITQHYFNINTLFIYTTIHKHQFQVR